MNKRMEEKITKTSKLIAIMVPIIVFIAGAGWKLYAEDKIDSQIIAKTSPIEIKVDSNTQKIAQIEFMGKQTLVLMQKIATKKQVKEMKEETEMFRPKGK